MESNTFSITPMSQSFSLYPGKSYKGSIKIVNFNDSKDDLHNRSVVAPNATKKVSYTITVPETAASGGQYATIGVSSNPDDSKDMITNVFELASVIY